MTRFFYLFLNGRCNNAEAAVKDGSGGHPALFISPDELDYLPDDSGSSGVGPVNLHGITANPAYRHVTLSRISFAHSMYSGRSFSW